MSELIEEPTFNGSYDPSVLDQLSIDIYFKNTHPQRWHPMEFVSKRRVESLAPFVTGLEVVGRIRSPPSAYARTWISFLKTEAGVLLQRKALSVIVIRREAEKQTIELTKLQVGFSSATYGPQGVVTSDNRKSFDGKHARDDDNGTEKLPGTPTKRVYDIADDYKEISAGQKHSRDDDMEHPVTPTKDTYYIGEDDKDHSGELQDFMDDTVFSTALDALPTMPNLPQDQQVMLDSLFEGNLTLERRSERIDDLMKVSNPVPALNRYIFTSFQPFCTAFMNTGTISQDINERHYFRDYVVELLRGALSVHGIPYIWGEIYVPAVSYRKANDADATARGKFADGASESEGHQILLSESSKLHRAPASKDQDDKMKLKRMLRDLFNFTILEMTKNKERVKPSLTVFGSRTFKDTTELIAMDYHGMYRTYCLGSFKIVATANNVKNLKECFEMCLRFSMAVKEQATERSEM
ncbi:hypothetical protein BGZ81_005197, partial [Podila clonocystis]